MYQDLQNQVTLRELSTQLAILTQEAKIKN